MESVTISQKYQVVIPQKVRRMMGIKPGQKIRVIAYDNQIVLIPVRPISEARGSLKGIETEIEREEQERV
jgi:AbrB family looped-hinge helix DNA binding protein